MTPTKTNAGNGPYGFCRGIALWAPALIPEAR